MHSGSVDLELMRASMLLETDPQAAVRAASAILEREPGHEAAGLLFATACRNLGDSQAALDLLQPLAAAQPGSAVLQLELGRACAATARNDEARAAFQSAAALDPRLADAWLGIARLCFLAGDTAGGDSAYTRYERLAPLSPELLEAATAIDHNRLELASGLLQQRLQKAPEDVAALRMYALCARSRGRYAEMEHYLQRALALAPGYTLARSDLATELCVQQRYAEAAPQVQRLLAAAPRHSGYLCLQAQILRFDGRNDEAGALLQRALEANPDDPMLHLHFGHLLRDQGEQARAIECYRRALALDPRMTEVYRSLADLKTVRFSADDRAAMLSLAADMPPGPQRIQLEFALGKAFEDEGLAEQAFGHYARGNAMLRATINHDPETMSAGVRRSKRLYSTSFFAERSGWGSERIDPIFIVGLPRSGSTLVEQILASHAQIEGTRELPQVPALAREILLQKNASGVPNYPDPIGLLTRTEVADYAQRYLDETAKHRASLKPRFVDKMLVNFDHIGLIHLMFPQATIVDVRRHPLACGFSCFRQLFGRGHPFTYDLRDMGRHYRDYFELMEHIDAVLPGRVHRVYYEALVGDPERVVRRLLAHCGLSFDPACLQFHANRRVVTTISSEQVRRPIYGDALEQWRAFEPWLGDLKDALGDIIERYPEPVRRP
jgi:tetratricopeptide (TPR) repeat protein